MPDTRGVALSESPFTGEDLKSIGEDVDTPFDCRPGVPLAAPFLKCCELPVRAVFEEFLLCWRGVDESELRCVRLAVGEDMILLYRNGVLIH